jgi:arylsulfatase A-like enzyme
MGPEMGCYGHPEVSTPNLDRVAREGVLYTNAYTTAAVCSPSRSAFMTGMYQMSIGAHNHRSHRDDGYLLPDGVRVITDILRDGGYFTGNIVDLSGNNDEGFYRGTGKTDWNFNYSGEISNKPFDTDKWSDLLGHQPFYAQINFPESHRGDSWDTAHEHLEKRADPANVQIPPYYPDHAITRKVWAQYLNAVMAFDKKVGFVLDLLDKEGLLENTVVVVFGDNGRAMVRSKQWPYEGGLHVPLLIRWPANFPVPDGFNPGEMDSRLLSIIDLSATTLSIAGIAPPMLMQGRVFLGEEADLPRQYVFGGRDRGDETVDRIRTVRDKRYRYIRNYYPERAFLQLNRYKEWSYPVLSLMRSLHEKGALNEVQEYLMNPTRPPEELYDLEQDPYEIKNLAASPEYSSLKKHLAAALDTWIMETNDQGRFPEPDAVIEHWEQEMKDYYSKREKSKIVY